MSVVSRNIDRLGVMFDHEGLVANAGLIVPATLMARLGIEALIDGLVRTGSSRPGRKILTVVRLHKYMKQAIAAIPETEWVDIDYTLGGQAQVAETIYTTGTGTTKRSVRLVVRRTRLTDKTQSRLWPDWRHHAFITHTESCELTVTPNAVWPSMRSRNERDFSSPESALHR